MRKMYIKPEVKEIITVTSLTPLMQPSRGVQKTSFNDTKNFIDMGYDGETNDAAKLWGSRENDYYDDEEE